MSVQILSVALDDETIERLAQRVAAIMQGGQPVPTAPAAAPPAQPPAPAAPAAPATSDYDPWAGTNAAPAAAPGAYAAPATAAPAAAPGTYAAGPSAAAPPANGGPVCAHGPMRFVPAGFSKSTGRAYGAFWGCPAPKGAPDKCGSVKV